MWFSRWPTVRPPEPFPVADGSAPWDLGSHRDQITSANQWRIESDVILRFQRIMGRGRVEVSFLHYMYDLCSKIFLLILNAKSHSIDLVSTCLPFRRTWRVREDAQTTTGFECCRGQNGRGQTVGQPIFLDPRAPVRWSIVITFLTLVWLFLYKKYWNYTEIQSINSEWSHALFALHITWQQN